MKPVTVKSRPEEILAAFKACSYWTKLTVDMQIAAAEDPARWLDKHPGLCFKYPKFFHDVRRFYTLIVLRRRRFCAFKNAVLLGASRIIRRLAGSEWVVTPSLEGDPRALQQVAILNHRSRRIIFWGQKPEEGNLRWNHVKLSETEFTPPFQTMPKRSFVMACRPLCGLDLRYPHATCLLFCRIRRTYYGLMSKVQELEAVWAIAPEVDRRNRRVREMLTKQLALIMEWAGS